MSKSKKSKRQTDKTEVAPPQEDTPDASEDLKLTESGALESDAKADQALTDDDPEDTSNAEPVDADNTADIAEANMLDADAIVFDESEAQTDAAENIVSDSAEDTPEEDQFTEIEETVVDTVLSEPEPAAPPPPAPPPPAPQKRSPIPLILAGVITAALGFFAGRSDLLGTFFPGLTVDSGATEQVEVLETRLAELQGNLDGAIATIATLAGDVEVLKTQEPPAPQSVEVPQQLLDRIATLETQIESGGSDGAASTELEEQFNSLQSAAQTQQADMEALLAELRARDEAAQDGAARAQARTAMAQVNAALSSGGPYADALASIDAAIDVTIPDGLLTHAADGVPTLAALQEEIADNARAALASARAENATGGGLGNFVQRQLGLRSVAPRDGDDPDAVLSRVEAAVKQGDIAAALDEAAALPETARAAMADWLQAAEIRNEAIQAADALNADLAG